LLEAAVKRADFAGELMLDGEGVTALVTAQCSRCVCGRVRRVDVRWVRLFFDRLQLF